MSSVQETVEDLQAALAQVETRFYPRRFTLIARTPRACASFLAALPSTCAIETRSLSISLAANHRGFAFYHGCGIAFPKSSIPSVATCSMHATT